MSLLDLTVGHFQDEVAARTPAPGGGAVAAMTAATAAALVAMAARFSGQPADRAEELRARLGSLADEDAAAYSAVLAAPRGQRAAALAVATDVPREIAAAATEIGELARDLAASGNPNLLGDARVAQELAEAAARAARVLVKINVAEGEDG
jgi:formiminotetrahydrofolate cyclodeaminase